MDNISFNINNNQMKLNMKSIESEYFGENSERNSAISKLNHNLYKFEIECGISKFAEPTSGPIFSFWSQSKTFQWNFNKKISKKFVKE